MFLMFIFDNLKVFSLDNLATKTIDKPVGEYKVKWFKIPQRVGTNCNYYRM